MGSLWSVLLLSCLAGCHRPSGEHIGYEGEHQQATTAPALTDGRSLSRTDILLQIARLSHAEVATRLGPHRIESHTHYTIRPLSSNKPQPPEVTPGFRADGPVHPYEGGSAWENTEASLDETRFIAVDAAGNVQLQNLNDHDFGVEALFDREYLYIRMRYAPYIRHRPEGDELERLRALGYESGAALLEAVAPYVYLSTPGETTRLGRSAWQVSLSRQQPSPKRHQSTVLGKAWRDAVAVDSLDGYAVVDRQRGALLELRLSVRFQAPRGKTAPGPGTPPADGEQVQVEAQHELRVVSLGNEVAPIAPPAEWSEPPTRARPMLEKQELLNGLLPARGP